MDATLYEARRAALRRQILEFSEGAFAVYAAEKVAGVREFRAQITRDPGLLIHEGAARSKLDHYARSLAMLEHERPDHPLVRELRIELEALQPLPRRRAQPSAGSSSPCSESDRAKGAANGDTSGNPRA